MKRFTAGTKLHNLRDLEIEKLTCIEDIRDVLETASRQYQDRRKFKTLKKWFASLSARLQFYGNVLDMMVQHHPEYVSLVWGAMKFLIVVCLEKRLVPRCDTDGNSKGAMNHEKTIATLLNALCEISDALPRMKIAAELYPTERMQAAVEQLYLGLLSFFTRALEWFLESPWRHVLHSITQPVELRFDDLLKLVNTSSRNVEQLAVSAS